MEIVKVNREWSNVNGCLGIKKVILSGLSGTQEESIALR